MAWMEGLFPSAWGVHGSLTSFEEERPQNGARAELEAGILLRATQPRTFCPATSVPRMLVRLDKESESASPFLETLWEAPVSQTAWPVTCWPSVQQGDSHLAPCTLFQGGCSRGPWVGRMGERRQRGCGSQLQLLPSLCPWLWPWRR